MYFRMKSIVAKLTLYVNNVYINFRTLKNKKTRTS